MSLLLFFKGGGSTTQTLAPGLYTNSNTFYAATVTPGAVTLAPARYDNTNQFYSPTVSYSNTLVPGLLTNTNEFYSPTVSAPYVIVQYLLPSLYENTNTFYSASLFNEYPDPSQVLAGVVYGPNGSLVGTLTVGAGEAIIRLRSFTERH